MSTKERINKKRKVYTLRIIKVTVLFLVIVGLFVAAYRYIHNPLLEFGKIIITGNDTITRKEVLSSAGIDVKKTLNLFLVNQTRVEAGLASDYRIKKFTIKYNFPGELILNIRERIPAFYIKNAYGGFSKLTRDGHVLSVSNGLKDGSVPYITGIKVGNLYLGDKIENKKVLKLLLFMQRLSLKIRNEISEVVVLKKDQVKIIWKSQIPFYMGDIDELDAKYDVFMKIYNEVEGKNIDAKFIDLSYKKPYIKVNSDYNK